MAGATRESECLKCKITAVHLDHQERNEFLWLKSSCLSDTLVGQQKDGVIVVLGIKENGLVSRFVLDPSLTCAFWDNEDIKSHCQNLYAQHKNGGIVMYTVDEGGVTETVRVPLSKLTSLIEFSQCGLPKDLEIRLEGCDEGLVILNVGCSYTACIHVSSSGVLQMQSFIPLPLHHDLLGKSSGNSHIPPWHAVCHVVKGLLAVFDQQVNMISLYSIDTGNCVCQVDLKSFSSDGSLLNWKLSCDHSAIFLLDAQLSVKKIDLVECAGGRPSNVKWIDSEENDRAFRREHYKQNLCHFGDSVWRKEAVNHHATTSKSDKSKTNKRLIGFKAANLKKSPVQKSKVASKENVSIKSLELKEVKEDGWAVEAMEASSTIATLLLHREMPVNENAVCFVNFSDTVINLHRLPDATCMALSNTTSLHILWTENCLVYISPGSDLQKDDLISWMMAYSGPGTADALCQTNHWTRTTIPLSALVSSLQQRELETLTFYFKSKQGLFSNWKQSQQPVKLRNEIQEMENVLHLVSKTVANGIVDPQARIFARRLLSLTMDFLYSQLEDARDCLNTLTCDDVNVLKAMENEIQQSCTKILQHVSALRKNMHLLESRSSQNKGTLLSDVGTPQEEVDHGSDATLEQYAKDNRLSKLQALLQKNDGNAKSHRQITSQLLDVIKKYLMQKDISSCQQVLNNLGCEIIETLWRLSQFYTDRDLQDFITGQLISSASLTAQQREVVKFMHQLYQAYPNVSFDKALEAKNAENSCVWTENHRRLKNVMVSSSVFLPSQCGELSTCNSMHNGRVPDCQSCLYTSVPLAWLNEWTEDMKRSVLTEAEFLNSVDTQSLLKMDADVLWQFLASHNMLDTLETVVTKSTSQTPHKWPSDPVTCVQLGWSHLQKEILSLLLRLKKLNLSSCKSHEVDMQLLLRMVGGPLQQPHPLAYAGSSYLNQFHNLFINYCIRCGLQLPLWMYCSIHGIDVRHIKADENPVWFRSFKMFFSIPRDPQDTSSLLLASQLSAAGLWSPSSPSQPMSVESMLNQGQLMAAVATLSYMKQEDVVLSPETVEKYLQQFPKLKSILIPENANPSAKPKMTVYQLLLGNVSFNIRRLFGWHSTNSLAGEDSPRAMPQFSDASGLGVVTTQQKLAFTYYLKQGRPMYAFLAFLVDELDKQKESISEKRINQACGACLWVAVQNFAESRVTSGCVVFVEMLGKDSSLVRSMVHAGRILLSNKTKAISPHDNEETQKEETIAFANAIAQELQECIQSRRRFGPKLILSLQTMIANEIKDENLKSTSFEASQKWTMVNMLCHLLHLPLSTVFLKACAETDNWLMFVWFAQLHQYPIQQLQGLLHSFKSIHYRDHLHYVLNNAESKLISSSSLSSSISSSISNSGASNDRRNVSQRSALYDKIGLKNDHTAFSSTDEEEKVKESPPVLSSFSSRLRYSEFHESEMPESMAPDDVFRMLFHSQAAPCQWRCLLAAAVSLSNPLFAELAACCGCPAIPSVCGWLLSSLDSSVKHDFLNHHGQLVSKWAVDKLELLIDVAMDSQREDTLATVFFLMQNKSPLLPFFCFINECMERGHHAASKTYINQFKDAMATFENQVDPNNLDPGSKGELAIIGDRNWIEKIVYQVITHILKHTTCLYRSCRFLELLDKHNMSLVFRFDVLNFKHLHQVVKILNDNEIVGINLVSLLTSGTKSPHFVAECEKAVDFLIENGKFAEAMELARVTEINKEKVILGQLREEKQRLTKCGLWTARYVRAQFWEKSCKMMKAANSSFTACEQFFQTQLEGTEFEYEKALLCHHWFFLLEETDDPDFVGKRENIFRNMWRHRIAAKMSFEEQEALDHIFDYVKVEEKQRYLKSDLVLSEVKSLDVSDVQEDLSPPELEVLESLMGSYLEQGQVNACARVASVFGYYSQDLAIIQTCIALSCGKNTIENIEPAMRRLVAKGTINRRRLSSINKTRSFSSCSLDSMSSMISDDGGGQSKVQETIKVMEKLCEHCNKGRQVCRRIITCFKIAEILGMSYQEVVQVQEFVTLHRLLVANHVDKFFLAKEFLSTSGLLDEEVTEFLAGLILETLKAIVSRSIDTETSPNKGLNSVKPLLKSSDGMEVFGQFIKLSENASLLGDKILQAVASLVADDGSEMVSSGLTVQTEMIILSHDCYTNASNMEGISHVLRAARVCCHCLAQAGEFSLMIRLLTGVGRYSEMQYVFHLLQQHHQFELLLRKGMDREDKLKVAILEYLKRYQPDDNDAYSMVALKFSMYRDIAGLLEKCGNRALRHMKIKTLENNKETQESLRKCLQYFQEAAESYVKDMSVRKAQRCIKMTRLLSLQQQLLPSAICVINLSREETLVFVSNHTRFIESMVVADAYEQKVNWRDAIYNNVLVGGDTRYLQELKLHVHITPNLVEDVLHKYKNSSTKVGTNLTGVRKLLGHCKDAQLQYKLASELGLSDVVSTMLKGDTGNYLQDVTIV